MICWIFGVLCWIFASTLVTIFFTLVWDILPFNAGKAGNTLLLKISILILITCFTCMLIIALSVEPPAEIPLWNFLR